jgi:hypothetical protein
MKIPSAFPFFLALTVYGAQGQGANNVSTANQTAAVPAPTPYQIVESGPHHRVWQWQTFEPMPDGQFVPHTHSYRELASGLNYQDPATGQWVSSQNTIEAFSGGALVRHCQNQIIFANNLNTPGAVDMQTPGSSLFSVE